MTKRDIFVSLVEKWREKVFIIKKGKEYVEENDRNTAKKTTAASFMQHKYRILCWRNIQKYQKIVLKIIHTREMLNSGSSKKH